MTLAGTASALPSTGSVVAPSGQDAAVSFDADGTTFHGSLHTPDGDTKGAALLIPGSGPSDRNGNQSGIARSDVLIRIADSLAAQGIASLRFDKIGAGETGPGRYTTETIGEYGFTDQVDHAAAAADLLAERTGVPTSDILVLGHSEGGLTALALADRGVGRGFGLLQPLPMRYLDLISAQLTAVSESGQLSPEEAETVRTDVARAVESLRTTGTVPADLHPIVTQLGVNEDNAKFLSEADRLDPPALAARLEAGIPVMLTCSDKDLNISCEQIDPLRHALEHTDLRFERFATSNHHLEEIGPLPPSAADVIALLPVSAEFAAVIDDWAAQQAG